MVLVLAPHTDDDALGCGGSMVRFAQENHKVHVAALSSCDNNDLVEEFMLACSKLGATGEVFNVPVRRFNFNRQLILDNLIALREKCQPDIVLLPNHDDIHQDHKVVHDEGVRAFKGCTMLGYELPWNSLVFRSTAFVKLKADHVERKLEAVACYKSQAHRPYTRPDAVMAQLRMRGTAIGTEYAEAFEAIRYVV